MEGGVGTVGCAVGVDDHGRGVTAPVTQLYVHAGEHALQKGAKDGRPAGGARMQDGTIHLKKVGLPGEAPADPAVVESAFVKAPEVAAIPGAGGSGMTAEGRAGGVGVGVAVETGVATAGDCGVPGGGLCGGFWGLGVGFVGLGVALAPTRDAPSLIAAL